MKTLNEQSVTPHSPLPDQIEGSEAQRRPVSKASEAPEAPTTKPRFEKKVIDGVYETSKVLLTLEANSVTKRFKPRKSRNRRYQTEKLALQRLAAVSGTPNLLEVDDDTYTLKISRLPGSAVNTLSEQNLKDLAEIVENMLTAGVARHAMPIRDIVIDERGKVGLVDFERATLRSWLGGLIWITAAGVSRYHLYRLMSEHQPQILLPRQWWRVNIGRKLRGCVAYIHAVTRGLKG